MGLFYVAGRITTGGLCSNCHISKLVSKKNESAITVLNVQSVVFLVVSVLRYKCISSVGKGGERQSVTF
jgi:hypothetical protein